MHVLPHASHCSEVKMQPVLEIILSQSTVDVFLLEENETSDIVSGNIWPIPFLITIIYLWGYFPCLGFSSVGSSDFAVSLFKTIALEQTFYCNSINMYEWLFREVELEWALILEGMYFYIFFKRNKLLFYYKNAVKINSTFYFFVSCLDVCFFFQSWFFRFRLSLLQRCFSPKSSFSLSI